MNQPDSELGTEFFVGAVILIVVIFYLAYRFVNRAKKVNKEVRKKDIREDDDTV